MLSDCGHLVKTRLPSFLPISWHLFLNEKNFSQRCQLLLIPIHTLPPGTQKGVQIGFNLCNSHSGVCASEWDHQPNTQDQNRVLLVRWSRTMGASSEQRGCLAVLSKADPGRWINPLASWTSYCAEENE